MFYTIKTKQRKLSLIYRNIPPNILIDTGFLSNFTTCQWSCGKVLVSFCLPFCPQQGSHVTSTHDALDLTWQGPPPAQDPGYGTPLCQDPPPTCNPVPHTWDLTILGPPVSDIWCPNWSLFIWGPPLVLTSGGYWSTYSCGKWAVRTLLECFLVCEIDLYTASSQLLFTITELNVTVIRGTLMDTKHNLHKY